MALEHTNDAAQRFTAHQAGTSERIPPAWQGWTLTERRTQSL